MDLFTQNKLLIQAAFVIVVVGAIAFFSTSTPQPATPAQEATEESVAGDTTPITNVPTQSAQKSVQKPKPAQEGDETSSDVSGVVMVDKSTVGPVLAILKDVGEPFYYHLGLTEVDFREIRNAGFDVIEGNFDICADDVDVRFFLDNAIAAGLKVILNAGAGEAEWGYTCDGDFIPGQKPVWQKEKVKAWVEKWKNHDALYAWDTSNEDGGTFPFGTGGVQPDPNWETKYALSVGELQQAYSDVKSFDPSHPVLIRMNGWYFYDYADNFFRSGNSFGENVADIVMINAYSNTDEYFKDFVSTVLMRAARAIYAIDPGVKLIPALGVWGEPPTWVKPTRDQLVNDHNQALKAEGLLGIAFFKYGAREGDDWFLPDASRGALEIWQTIKELNK